MAKVITSYGAEFTSTGYIYERPDIYSSHVQYDVGTPITLPADYAAKIDDGFYPVIAPSGWVLYYEIGNITANYTTTTDTCAPPSSVTLNVNTKVLTITGGAGGDLNTFQGWGVSWRERQESGTTWGSWSDDTVTTTNVVNVTVNAGMVRQFRVRTRGSAGSSYYSAYVECPTLLVGITAATAPTSIYASQTSPEPGTTITIGWSGAAAGVSNPITGYELWQSTSRDGTYSKVKSVSSTATDATTTYTSSLEIGETMYFKVKTIGTTSGYDSGLSSYVLAISGGYGLVTAPTVVRLSSSKHYANGVVRLEWSGAADGYENPVKSYEVYRSSNASSGYTLIANIANATETFVVAPASNGGVYYYKVKTIGAVNGFSSGLSSAYASLTSAAYTHKLVGRTNAVV